MKNPLCAALVFLMLLLTAFPVKAPKVVHLPVTAARWEVVTIDAYVSTGATPFSPDMTTDGLYWLPTMAQLTAMDKWVFPKMHRTYVSESWDCDDMAFEWRVLTHRWAVENVTKQAPIAIATFICYVDIHSGAFDGRWSMDGKHALGLLCDSDGTWWYVEPRTGLHQKVEEAKFEGTIEAFKIVW